jgi:hypothetical protein
MEKPLGPLPTNVQRFAGLWAISALMAVPAVLLMPAPDHFAVKAGITQTVQLAATGGILLILYAILLPLFWLAVWRGRDWCRWVLLGLFVASLPFLFLSTLSAGQASEPLTIVSYVATALEALAFIFVFTGDARPWFRADDDRQ